MSPDDRTLYALTSDRADGPRNRIMAAQIPSGLERAVWTETAENGSLFAISLSPDGRRLAFGRQRVGVDGGITIGIVNVDGSDPRQLTVPAGVSTNESSLAWSRDGQSVYFVKYAEPGTSTSATQYQLMKLRIDSGAITPLTVFFNGWDFRMDVRSDDGAVAFSEVTREEPTVWSVDNIDISE